MGGKNSGRSLSSYPKNCECCSVPVLLKDVNQAYYHRKMSSKSSSSAKSSSSSSSKVIIIDNHIKTIAKAIQENGNNEESAKIAFLMSSLDATISEDETAKVCSALKNEVDSQTIQELKK